MVNGKRVDGTVAPSARRVGVLKTALARSIGVMPALVALGFAASLAEAVGGVRRALDAAQGWARGGRGDVFARANGVSGGGMIAPGVFVLGERALVLIQEGASSAVRSAFGERV